MSGDTVGAATIPYVAGLQQEVRTASGLPDYVASIGQGLLSVYREERITPGTAELGITDRFSFALTVPLVREETRTAYQLNSTGANLGPNPLSSVSGVAGASQAYSAFFTQFSGALTQLGDSLAGGHYGCPFSPACSQARQTLNQGQAVYSALENMVYGVGAQGSPSPLLPTATSTAGAGIDSTISGLQRSLTTYNVSGFTSTFMLASDSLYDQTGVGNFEQAVLTDPVNGFGYLPFQDSYTYGLGNIELEAKYRIIDRRAYKLALAMVARLPTATRDTTLQVIDAPTDQFGPGFEARVLQQFSIGGLWINLSARGGTQNLATRSERVAPFGSILVPAQATTTLDWTGGSYAEFEIAPLYHLAPEFSAGFTLSYWTKAADQYAYQSPSDSINLATALGVPLPANLLDVGTSERWLRFGFAVTYIGPIVEGDFTVGTTLSGSGGAVPDATIYQIVFRVSPKLF